MGYGLDVEADCGDGVLVCELILFHLKKDGGFAGVVQAEEEQLLLDFLALQNFLPVYRGG